jgi:hypothetical protein
LQGASCTQLAASALQTEARVITTQPGGTKNEHTAAFTVPITCLTAAPFEKVKRFIMIIHLMCFTLSFSPPKSPPGVPCKYSQVPQQIIVEAGSQEQRQRANQTAPGVVRQDCTACSKVVDAAFIMAQSMAPCSTVLSQNMQQAALVHTRQTATSRFK